jgi:tyrosyl-tRNA synthetase
MLERDDFTKRFKEQTPISIHEFLYPLVQGYDSVEMKADVELGGTDQKFNLLVGRELQKSYNQPGQCVITVPILEGIDGVQKMSKSLNNYIAVEDVPKDMFGKTMRITDDLMIKYYELLTDMTVEEVKTLKSDIAAGKKHPREAKVNLAKILVTRFHNDKAATQAEDEFNRIFVSGGLPDDIPEVNLNAENDITVLSLLVKAGLATSNGEARRLVEGMAVEIDNEKIKDPKLKLDLVSGKKYLVKAGKKKFAHVLVS